MDVDIARAELLGVLAGDGCLSHSGEKNNVKYYVYCCGNGRKDKKYMVRYVAGLFLRGFNKSVVVRSRPEENVCFIKCSDKALFNTLRGLGLPVGRKYRSLTIPQFVLDSRQRKLAFLRGLFDTDGCVVLSKQHHTRPYYPRIEISSKSRTFLAAVSSVLAPEGISGSISNKGKNNFRLELAGIHNLTRWQARIGSSNSRNRQTLLNAAKTYLKASRNNSCIRPRSLAVERARE